LPNLLSHLCIFFQKEAPSSHARIAITGVIGGIGLILEGSAWNNISKTFTLIPRQRKALDSHKTK